MQDILVPLSTLKQIRDSFVGDLRQVSRGKKTSLAFIKNPLPHRGLVNEGEEFQIMVVGGSVFESALVVKKKNTIHIVDAQKAALETFTTKNTLFAFIAYYLSPKTRVLAINFAFPLNPVIREGVLDGVYIGSAEKQHGLVGLAGKLVGKALENYLNRQGKTIVVTIGHDLLCLALSDFNKENSIKRVFGIVGTGCNFGFFLDAKTFINIEAGRFDKFDQTETGKIVDKGSKSPGKKRFEKEVSGIYLYQHFNLLMTSHVPLTTTKELDTLAKGKGEAVKIAQQLFEHSASLVACQIAGIYEFKKQPKLTFVMEGSLFWKGWHYKQMVEEYLEKLGLPKEAMDFVKIPHSALRGAAALVA